ncbi:hypothetical protein CMUS01_01922 [Colletotrichum musicola]|uniref:Uncharacterized protein n=1 Tax=Colletotrichum musicola TaxID=2175873 RepID=A0A8H6NVY4_9PEZI|nr:hypothetical protein CMUS01_01922 [Colletotrichum musicola]
MRRGASEDPAARIIRHHDGKNQSFVMHMQTCLPGNFLGCHDEEKHTGLGNGTALVPMRRVLAEICEPLSDQSVAERGPRSSVGVQRPSEVDVKGASG